MNFSYLSTHVRLFWYCQQKAGALNVQNDSRVVCVFDLLIVFNEGEAINVNIFADHALVIKTHIE